VEGFGMMLGKCWYSSDTEAGDGWSKYVDEPNHSLSSVSPQQHVLLSQRREYTPKTILNPNTPLLPPRIIPTNRILPIKRLNTRSDSLQTPIKRTSIYPPWPRTREFFRYEIIC